MVVNFFLIYNNNLAMIKRLKFPVVSSFKHSWNFKIHNNCFNLYTVVDFWSQIFRSLNKIRKLKIRKRLTQYSNCIFVCLVKWFFFYNHDNCFVVLTKHNFKKSAIFWCLYQLFPFSYNDYRLVMLLNPTQFVDGTTFVCLCVDSGGELSH